MLSARNRKRLMIAVAVWGVVWISALSTMLFFYHEVTRVRNHLSGELILTIHSGMSGNRIARLLVERGVLPNRWSFLLLLDILDQQHSLRHGTYRFTPEDTVVSVIRRLSKGAEYLQPFQIPPGISIHHAASLFEAQGWCTEEELLAYSLSPEKLSGWQMESRSLEGFLFPETYSFRMDVTFDEVLSTILDMFQKRAQPVLEEGAALLNRDPYDILIVASLIEKEAGAESEKPLVASVLYNRLQRNMRLQCDPTVRYGFPNLKDRLRTRHLHTDHPYNTYLHNGLTPGPICNPGLSSLHAAANPARSSYLYFVSRGDGTHAFSKSLKEHNKLVRKYILS